MCEICSKFTIQRSELRHWQLWIYFIPFLRVSVVDFEQKNVCCFQQTLEKVVKYV